MTIKQLGGVFGRNPTFNDVTIDGELILNGEIFTGLDFQGSWNAATNTPTLASGVGTTGEFYIVSVAGTTNLDGITNWGVGDWAMFSGSAWQRVEGNADGNFVNLSVSNEATFSGLVGIGTTPSYTLTVQKDVDDYIAKLENDGNSTSSNGLWVDTRWNTATNTVFKVTTNSGGTDVITAKGDGNVGIGTSSVNRKLEVSGNNNAGSKANYIRITDTDTSATANNQQGGIEFYTNDSGNENVTASIENLYAGSGAGSELTFNTAPNGSSGVSERLRITEDGLVGIGTSLPDTGLEVATTNYTFAGTTYDIYGLFGDTSGGIRLGADSSNDDSVIGTTGTNDLQFVTYNGSAWDSRMTLTSAGSVGIGTSSPASALDVTGTVTADGLTVEGSSTGGTYITSASGSAAGDIKIEHIINSGRNLNTINSETGSGGAIDLAFAIGGTERMRIDSSGNLLVGKTSVSLGAVGVEVKPNGEVRATASGAQSLQLNRLSSDGTIVDFRKDSTTVGSIGTADGDLVIGSKASGHKGVRFGSNYIAPINTSDAFEDNTTDLGLPAVRFKDLYLSGSVITGGNTTNNFGSIDFKSDSVRARIIGGYASGGGGYLKFHTDSSGGSDLERMRIDASGNLLVGTTNANNVSDGIRLKPDGFISAANTSGPVLYANRLSTDGSIISFQKDGTTVGNIGVVNSDNLRIGGVVADHAGLQFGTNILIPETAGTASDGLVDIGTGANRYQDVYATNGTIQTSDGNEKQDIEELSEAEQRVAVAAKVLLRKFRWKSAVEAKGDEARTHFGIIAQDLQAAFAAEGLDAGDYGMFINSTWTDEETGEERSRMGVRYSELLAFIISAI